MGTLIEFYDKDALKNISAVLALKPERVVFLYDNGIEDMECFRSLEKCFVRNILAIKMETYPVNSMSIEDVYYKIVNVEKSYPGCMIDLTGGSELMIIAGYKAGSQLGLKMLYVDIVHGQIWNLEDKNDVVKTVKLSLHDFLDVKGAQLLGNSHLLPKEKDEKKILAMCRYLFENLKKWKSTCRYIQQAHAVLGQSSEDLYFRCASSLADRSGSVSPDRAMLYTFSRHGFIRNLDITKERIIFHFTSPAAKQYMMNFGVWLELFVYIHAKRVKEFDDAILGAVIDWNAYDGTTVVGNEIDVMVSHESMPVFISCKMRDCGTADINELLVAKKRLGGWFSKGILVSYGNDKKEKTGTYKRAKELGIDILDKEDILSENFEQILLKTVVKQDLVNMKWRKV